MNPPSLEDVQRAVGDHYEVLDLAGVGGMGAVFRARHRTLEHLVAVKVLPPDVATSQMRQDRFRREASLAAQLSHPNIVPVYEFDTREGLSFLIMPFVRGETLERALAARPPMPVHDLLQLLRGVAAALDVAHRRGVVHRDVKPANILIEEDSGRPLLTDFGVARIREPPSGALTAPGSVIGTPDYMAPEQMVGQPDVDGRADLYSLGLVAFEALTGTRPSLGADRTTLARSLRGARPEISGTLATALVSPLADRPGDRPSTGAEWLSLIDDALPHSWPRLAAVAGLVVALGGALWLVLGRPGPRPAVSRSLAVMPFSILGTSPQLMTAQLPTWFLQRLGYVSHLQIVSPSTVTSLTEGREQVISEAESVAVRLGATYFVQPILEYRGTRVHLTAKMYETAGVKLLSTGEHEGSVDSLSQIMDSVWNQVLPSILRQNFAPVSGITLPRGLPAMLAYAAAEDAFRRGDYATALDEYEHVLTNDSAFALAYFRRAIVVAQVDPREESLRQALSGAQRHQSGLAPADSLLLEGYRLLLDRGDGRAALERFRTAAEAAPDQPQAWFTLGEFYYHYGALFDENILEAEAAFNRVLDLAPNFAPAIAHLISLAHLRGDLSDTRRLIAAYEAFGTTSVVAEAVGIADTLLLHGPSAQLKLLRTARNHSFTALEYLAFQAQQFGTRTERQIPARGILRALEQRATTDSQKVTALRFGVAADLGEGWVDSARARLARASTAPTLRERDMWLTLLRVTGLDTLGDWRASAGRLDRAFRDERAGGEAAHWLLARLGVRREQHLAALQRLAVDSGPVAVSLLLDLEAQRALERGDTAEALRIWDVATQRYSVLRVGFDLVASLWPLRLEMVRVAVAHHDAAAQRACESFTTLMGYVDVVALPAIDQPCAPWRPARN